MSVLRKLLAVMSAGCLVSCSAHRPWCACPLRSVAPLVSPAIWTTIATGVPRERHGIHDFDFKDRRLIESTDRKFESLWSIASAAKMRSIVIGWWATYPAEKIDGVMISERALKIREDDVNQIFGGKLRPPVAAALVHPPEVATQVGDLLFHLFHEHEVVDPSAVYSSGMIRSFPTTTAMSIPFWVNSTCLRGPIT